MNENVFSGRRPHFAAVGLFSLVLLVLLAGGCSCLKGTKKDPVPTPSCPPEAVKSECDGTCPATQASHSPATVSVSGSEPAPDGSVVSGEEIPASTAEDIHPPAPPATADSTTSQYLNQQQGEIIRNPNGEIPSSGILPAGYQEPAAGTADRPANSPASVPIQQSEIPNGYSGLTQTAQNQNSFQNVSQESAPSRSRVQFRTVIEKE